MRFITMTAKYPGMCRRCQTGINPGTRMRYGGRGRTYHLAAECPASIADAAIPAYLRDGEQDRRAALGLDPASPPDPRLVAAENAARMRDRAARMVHAGERSMEAEMDRAYAGEARY